MTPPRPRRSPRDPRRRRGPAAGFALGAATTVAVALVTEAVVSGELPLAIATVALALAVLAIVGRFARALDEEQDPGP